MDSGIHQQNAKAQSIHVQENSAEKTKENTFFFIIQAIIHMIRRQQAPQNFLEITQI